MFRKVLFFVVFILVICYHKILFAFSCKIEKILDGNVFICSKKKVRLIGVDIPEFRKEAKEYVSLIMPIGTVVRLELDVKKKDEHNRLLAYLWLPDGKMLNEVILREGYARPLFVPPNTKYEDELNEAYKEALIKRKGIWKNYTITNKDLEFLYKKSSYKKPEEEKFVSKGNESEGNRFKCGEKYYCFQMSSCEEAMFYYHVCGLKKLDGDNDGVPCENLCGRNP